MHGDKPFSKLNELALRIEASRSTHQLTQFPVSNDERYALMPVELLFIEFEAVDLERIDSGYLDSLTEAYARDHLSINPILVKPVFRNNQLRLSVIDGHLRFLAMMQARKSGAVIPAVAVTSFYEAG